MASDNIAACFRALDSKQFRTYLLGQTCSALGSGMQTVAIGWLVWRLTHSASALAALGACLFVPQILFSVLGGCLADRIERRRLLCLLQASGVVLCLGITLSLGLLHTNVWLILGLAFLFGVFAALEYPARQAFSASVLPVGSLASARGLYACFCSLALAVGTIAGGVLVEMASEAGETACIFVNAMSYLVSWFMLVRVAKMPALEGVVPASKAQHSLPSERPPQASLKDCLVLIRQNKKVALTFVQTAVLVLLGLRYVVLIPALAQEIFAGAAGATGMLHAALAVGFAFAALGCGALARRAELSRFGTVSLLVLPIALSALSLSHHLWLGLCFMLILAFLQSANVNACVAGLQIAAPDGMYGRLTGLRVTLVATLDLVGATVVGQLVPVFGLSNTLIGSAVACFILAALSSLAFVEESGLPLPARAVLRVRRGK